MFAGGTALLVGSGWLAARGELSDEEVSAFRALNEQSDAMRNAAWALMLGGTFGAVPAAAGIALMTGRRRLALELAIGGTGAYLLAKGVKPIVGRARPHGLLRGVRFRDEIGGNEGWISGHAAVSSSLALIAAPELSPAGRTAAYGAAAAIGLSRLYAGAHLPLDVVGGSGLALMIAALMPDPRAR
jgi:undecaprenyl-diphosphatase